MGSVYDFKLIEFGLGWLALCGSDDVGIACGMKSNTARNFLRVSLKHNQTTVLIPVNVVDTDKITWWRRTIQRPLSLVISGLCRLTKDHNVRDRINKLFSASHANVELLTALLNALRDAVFKNMTIQTGQHHHIPLGILNLMCITPDVIGMVAKGQMLPTSVVTSLLYSSLATTTPHQPPPPPRSVTMNADIETTYILVFLTWKKRYTIKKWLHYNLSHQSEFFQLHHSQFLCKHK